MKATRRIHTGPPPAKREVAVVVLVGEATVASVRRVRFLNDIVKLVICSLCFASSVHSLAIDEGCRPHQIPC